MAQIQKQQTKAGLAVAAAFALAAFLPTQAAALPAGSVGIVAGDFVKLYDGPGTTGGGEFWADVVGKGFESTPGNPVNATNYDFIAYCLEYNETFNAYGQSLKVDAVNFGAVNGGLSGQTTPGYDPISNETAWLYTQAMTGSLANYAHTAAKANSLQRAIWFLEGELPTYNLTGGIGDLGGLDSQAKTWVLAAQASGWTNIGDVRVLNLLKQDSHGNYTLNAQDQLYLQPHTVTTSVPEPETYAMLLAGLGLMGFVARRRKARASQG